ncbi:hypothetical protein [Escherichia coli]|uniref:hypothetical protein n=1 Tax=Escherichia coli TaxID=562 RepID=UPI00398949F8
MTTFTKEQLISHARESVSYLEDLKGRVSKEGVDCKVVHEMVERDLKLARIALTSLEAEPVAWLVTLTKNDQESVSIIYRDCAEKDTWVRIHESLGSVAHVAPLYMAQPEPSKEEKGRSVIQGKADNSPLPRYQVIELTMLVKQLVSQLKKAKPDCKLPDRAMDYLLRNGLLSVEDALR